jgi:hypothetical protein
MNRSLAISFTTIALLSGCNSTTTMNNVPANLPPLALATDVDGGTAANFACNGSFKDSKAGPAADTMVTGLIKDFQDSWPVVGATVAIYTSADQVLANMPLATSSVSDMNGNYTIKVPAGAPYRVIRGVQGGGAVSNGNNSPTVPAFEFGVPFDDKSPVSVKQGTKEAIPGLVSVVVQDGTGIVAGAVHDCDDKETSRALVKVTSSNYDSSAPPPNNLMFYFVKVSGATIPTRTQKWTGEGGAFAALNVTPAPGVATIEATGIISSGGPQTIARAMIPIIANSVTIVHLLPLAAP